MRASILPLCTLASLATLLPAADTVWVEATNPTAYEEGLVPGGVTFKRSGSQTPLTVYYRIPGDTAGTARSTRHGGYLAGVTLVNPGVDYVRAQITDILVPGLTDPVASASMARFKQAEVSADSLGGQILTYTVTTPGTGYDLVTPPVVTVGYQDPMAPIERLGGGATATATVTGIVQSIEVTEAGGGYTGVPLVNISGGGGTGATGTAVMNGGQVQRITVTAQGRDYTSAPTVTLTGGGPATPAAVQATITGIVTGVTCALEGTGYVVPPNVTIADPPNGGTKAVATAVITDSGLSSVAVTNHGYGYLLPDVAVGVPVGAAAPTTAAVLRPVVNGSALEVLAVESGGAGYPMPTFTVSGGGSGALITAVLRDGEIIDLVLADGGIGYPTSRTSLAVTVTPAAGTTPVDAVVTAVTNAQGKVVGLNLASGGSNYVMPVVTLSGAGLGLGAANPTVSMTVDNGTVTTVTVAAGQTGYGDAQATQLSNIVDPYSTTTDWSPASQRPLFTGSGAAADLRIAPADYEAPASASIDPVTGTYTARIDAATGDLIGTIQFAVGETEKALVVTPRRNGIGGAKTINVNVDPPAVAGRYATNAQNSAKVTIADADDSASVSTVIPTAYPIPPSTDLSLPLEVQGRAELMVTFTGETRFRNLSFTIGGDAQIGPTATRGSDYVMVHSALSIAESANVYALVTARPAANQVTVAADRYMNGRIYNPDDVVCFVEPDAIGSDLTVLAGIYVVTKVEGRVLTLDRSVSYGLTVNQTRMRRLGTLLVPGSDLRLYGRTGPSVPFRLFAFPVLPQTAPRGRRSINVTFTQTDDYKVLTPASASLTLADTSVIAGLRWVANAGQPNTNGSFDLVLDSAFPVDVEVPFTIKSTSTATYYDGANDAGDYTIANVDTSVTPRRGVVRVPAGSTTARVEVVPRTSTPVSTSAETVDIVLDNSADYRLAPSGTSGVNPSVSLTIAPLYRTTLGESVYLAATRVQDGVEGSSPTNGILRVYLSASDGTPLTGVLTQDLSFAYSISGSATANTDYRALSGTATIATNANSVDLAVRVNDDLIVEGDEDVRIQIIAGAGYQVSSIATASCTIQDDEPVISVSAVSSPGEDGTAGAFTITASHAVNRSVTVRYAISGTATAGSDYLASALPGTVVIPPNQTTVQIPVSALSDLVYDPSETVILAIQADTQSPATYGVQSSASTGTMTIRDCPVLRLTATAVVEGVSGGGFVVTNACDQASPVAITVQLALGAGTATPHTSSTAGDRDYSPLPATVTLPAGSSTVAVPVTARFDGLAEGTETVILSIATDTLSPVAYMTLSSAEQPSTATVGISDPGLPTVIIAASANPVEGGANGAFTLTASNAWPADLTVIYQVNASSAAGSGDYVALAGTAVIPAGQTTVAVPVTARADFAIEGSESLIIDLIADAAYALDIARMSATLSIVDASAPVITVAAVRNPVEGATTGVVRFTNTRAIAHDQAVTVAYGVSGTATAGTDYVVLSGEAIIPANAASVDVPVTAVADAAYNEGAETIIVTVQSAPATAAVAYELSATVAATLSITDTTVDPSTIPPTTPVVTPVTGSTDSGGGCGAGSGIGFILAGAGLAGAALRRRRRDRA